MAPKSQKFSIFVSKPWNYFPIIREQKKFNFGGSEADICQTSNLQNGLFFASSNKAFKSLEIVKLIKNWISSFWAIYQNVQASVKFWYQIQIIRYFIAAEISHYLITVSYDHSVLCHMGKIRETRLITMRSQPNYFDVVLFCGCCCCRCVFVVVLNIDVVV